MFPSTVGILPTAAVGNEQPDASTPATLFAGSEVAAAPPAVPRRSGSPVEPYRETVLEKLRKELTAQRIWQDLVDEYGYGGSYEDNRRRAVRRTARGDSVSKDRRAATLGVPA